MTLIISKEQFDAVNAMTERHKQLSLIGEKFIIRPFKDWYDFLREGRTLRHAVHYYALNEYVNGKDYLFAMRSVEKADTPFITIEFDVHGNLVQAVKLHNSPIKDADESDFINHFREKILLPYLLKLKDEKENENESES